MIRSVCPAVDRRIGIRFPRDKREAFARRSCSDKEWSRRTLRRNVVPVWPTDYSKRSTDMDSGNRRITMAKKSKKGKKAKKAKKAVVAKKKSAKKASKKAAKKSAKKAAEEGRKEIRQESRQEVQRRPRRRRPPRRARRRKGRRLPSPPLPSRSPRWRRRSRNPSPRRRRAGLPRSSEPTPSWGSGSSNGGDQQLDGRLPERRFRKAAASTAAAFFVRAVRVRELSEPGLFSRSRLIRKSASAGTSLAAAFSGSSCRRRHRNRQNCCGNATPADNIFRNGQNA